MSGNFTVDVMYKTVSSKRVRLLSSVERLLSLKSWSLVFYLPNFQQQRKEHQL